MIAVFVLGAVSLAGPQVGPHAESLAAPQTAPGARPLIRWWWHGPSVDREELVRELDAVAEAGLGGVEIEALSYPGIAPEEVVHWLSPEWSELVRLAADEARARGLTVDLVASTGWPAGGDWLAGDARQQRLEAQRRELVGPGSCAVDLDELAHGDPLVGLFLLPDPCQRLEDVRALPAPAAGGVLALDLEPGNWSLVALARRVDHGRVYGGTPGGRQAVLDHLDREDVGAYVDHLTRALEPALGAPLGARVGALFSDSLELDRADWTERFPEEFRARRGYDLGPWLPFLAARAPASGELERDLARARYDRARTLAELAAEYGQAFSEGAHRAGLRSRLQAYGSPWLYGILGLYATADVPEGDAWLFQTDPGGGPAIDGVRAVLWNRCAASAAHQRGRRIVSCEAFTNTRRVFAATLEDVKQATDIALVMGVNQLVLHGLNHSPPEAGLPGRVRFGTWFDPANPWWPHLAYWSAYATRACSLLQATAPAERIAVVGPTADVWSARGLEREAWATTPSYLHGLWTAFSAAGAGADALAHSALAQAHLDGDRLVVGQAAYDALVLVEVGRLAAEAAGVVADFAQAGGHLLVVGAAPARDPGLRDAAARDGRVRAASERALHGPHVLTRAPFPSAPGESDDERDARLLAWVDAALTELGVERDLEIAQPDPRLLCSRRLEPDGGDAWLVANVSRDRPIRLRAALPGPRGWPRILDLERGVPIARPRERPTRRVDLTLGPLQSVWIEVLAQRGPPAPPRPRPGPASTARVLTGPWTVELRPMQGSPRTIELPHLRDLETNPTSAGFSGRAVYRAPLEVGPQERWDAIDLGRVEGSLEVRIDGRATLVPWGRRRVLAEIGPGSHELEIHVLTSAWNWARRSAARSAAFHTRGRPARPSGLFGPVRLIRFR